jgi:flagellar motor switch protein FliM
MAQQEVLSQDEIDRLTESIHAGEPVDIAQLDGSSSAPASAKYRYNDIVACKARYDYVLTNGSFQDIAEAAENLHRAAFANWLLKHKLNSKEDYYRLMNAEAKKRDMPPPFRRYVK